MELCTDFAMVGAAWWVGGSGQPRCFSHTCSYVHVPEEACGELTHVHLLQNRSGVNPLLHKKKFLFWQVISDHVHPLIAIGLVC